MAFSGNPSITVEGRQEIVKEFQNDAIGVLVRLSYTDSSDGGTVKTVDSASLLTNFSFFGTILSIGASDLNLEFVIDAGDAVTKVELRYTDSTGSITLDEYIETDALYTYGGKYVITGWSYQIT